MIDVSAGGVDARAVMSHGFLLTIGVLRAVFLSHADLVLENLALRQQLAAFARNGRRPRIVAADRLFWLALRRLWSRWSDVLVFLKPETVVHTLTRETDPRVFYPQVCQAGSRRRCSRS